MNRIWVVVAFLVVVASATAARADDGLTTIHNPGGGEIVYGPLTGATSLPSALGYVLRTVHTQFGDRPQVGKFFRARDSKSIATFFTLNQRPRGGGVKPISGLVIVSIIDGGQPAAAVMYDDAARFPRTAPAMMQKLGEAWHTAAAPPPAAPAAPAASPSLNVATGGDRSAGIRLPDGWRLTGVGHGRLTAEGPNGETIDRGNIFRRIHDQGIPRNGDLFDAFVSVSNEDRRRAHLPEGTYKRGQAQEVAHGKLEARAITAAFEVDLHDGKGPRTGSARIAVIAARGAPTWDMSVDTSNVPVTVAEAEAATMQAINASFTQDGSVIKRETDAVIARQRHDAVTHDEKMKEHMKQIDAHGAAFDAHMKDLDARGRAFGAHMDNMDRYSKAFQNNTFERSQVQDNDRNERATVSDADADALVKADPSRFQIVPTQDFLKGVDY